MSTPQKGRFTVDEEPFASLGAAMDAAEIVGPGAAIHDDGKLVGRVNAQGRFEMGLAELDAEVRRV